MFYDVTGCDLFAAFAEYRRAEWPDARVELHELRTAVADLVADDPLNLGWRPGASPEPKVARVRKALSAMAEVAGRISPPLPCTRDSIWARAKAVGFGGVVDAGEYVAGQVWGDLSHAMSRLESIPEPSSDDLLSATLAIDAAVDIPLAVSRAWVDRLQKVVDWRWPEEARNEAVILGRLLGEQKAAVYSGKVMRVEHLEMIRGLADELETKHRPRRMAVLPIAPEALMRMLKVPAGVRVVNVSFDAAHHAFMVAIEGCDLPVEPVPACERLPFLSPEFKCNEDGSIEFVSYREPW